MKQLRSRSFLKCGEGQRWDSKFKEQVLFCIVLTNNRFLHKGLMSVKKARTGSLIILTFQERVCANPSEPPESHHWCWPICSNYGCTQIFFFKSNQILIILVSLNLLLYRNVVASDRARPRGSAPAQLQRNIAAVASRWLHCVRFDQPGN